MADMSSKTNILAIEDIMKTVHDTKYLGDIISDDMKKL